MQLVVFGSRHHSQVVRMVVLLVAVDVMDVLAWEDWASNLLFGDNTMLVLTVVLSICARLYRLDAGKLGVAVAFPSLIFRRHVIMIAIPANALGVHAAVPITAF